MKTSAELNLTDSQYDALKRVRYGLATGLLIHVENYDEHGEEPDGYGTDPRFAFNMGVSGKTTPGCGTVACIGGWVYVLENWIKDPKTRIYSPPPGSKIEDEELRQAEFVTCPGNDALKSLFFPPDYVDHHSIEWVEWAEITAKMAVEAIDNYLNTGDPDWRSVLIRAFDLYTDDD